VSQFNVIASPRRRVDGRWAPVALVHKEFRVYGREFYSVSQGPMVVAKYPHVAYATEAEAKAISVRMGRDWLRKYLAEGGTFEEFEPREMRA
jgi:hypothetical protein